MIFIIPIILGAAALLTGGLGIAAGAEGLSNIQKAKKIGEDAQERYDRARQCVQNQWKVTQGFAEEYGQLQIQVKLQSIGRFVRFLERLDRRSTQDRTFLEGLEGFSPQAFQEYQTTALEAQTFAAGGFQAVGAAGAAGQSAITLIGLFGTASTGTAISGLSGAAAWNATLAWLGGGSLAAGGGGMALGTVVLGGIAIAPALLVGGFVVGGEGEKALTQAHKYEAKANIEIAKLQDLERFFEGVQKRILELCNLVDELNVRAIEGLGELESQPFDRDRDLVKFQQVAILIKALAEIMKIPVLDTEGNLNPATKNLKLKYGTF